MNDMGQDYEMLYKSLGISGTGILGVVVMITVFESLDEVTDASLQNRL